MNINIVSRDERYFFLNSLLNQNGFNSRLVSPNEKTNANVIILSVRDELTDSELLDLFENKSEIKLVFSGNLQRIKKYFNGKIIDYSKNEDFLQENAYLTAEATLSLFHSYIKDTIRGKKIFVLGYGRIGQCLAKIFSSVGAKIYVYARREEIKEQIKTDGFVSSSLDFSPNADLIINTAPATLLTREQIEKIPRSTTLFELASKNGFENTQRVVIARGLPGKILPQGAAKAIYDTIFPFLNEERTV